MRWKTGRRSRNVEDRRGRRVRRGIAGGGIGTIVLILATLYFGIDPNLLLQGLDRVSTSQAPPAGGQAPAADDEQAQFVSVVLADTEDTWQQLFAASGKRYQEPRLVLFTDAVRSACGFANAAVGPFYCPADNKVYLDLGFFRDLKRRFGAPGDFAEAYVIAHEVGHHVQNLLGVSAEVRRRQRGLSKAEANALSVRLELQADCFAGVWANQADRARSILEQGDIEEGLNAASAIGDDRLQRQAGGRVVPDSFTHGSSAQRVRWFRRGLASGDPAACDTFSR
ncbi:MAG: neutral zinc metallopeptidase [Chromatiales bacterium]|nr:MAG: neutral zinc metallopeptidase [Chromatiales bacterium]